MKEIENTIVQIAAKVLGVDASKISSESKFVEDLGADSLDQVELMMSIEAEFGYDIPDEDARKIATISDAVKYIEKRQTEAA